MKEAAEMKLVATEECKEDKNINATQQCESKGNLK